MPKIQFCGVCGAKLAVRKDNEGKDRLTCSTAPKCGYIFYDNPLPVVAAIVEHGNDVILIQNIGWPKSWFGLVTGFLEKGETPEAGCLREVQEELGLKDVEVVGLVGVYEFIMRNEVLIAYHVRASGPINMNTSELAAYKRVPIDELVPWKKGTGDAVRDWLASRQADNCADGKCELPKSKL